MKKWLLIIFLFIISVTVLLLNVTQNQEQQSEYSVLCDKCEKVNIGMTHDQVIEIMGMPKSISYVDRDTLIEEYWYYLNSKMMSTPIKCNFDSSTQKVIAIICGERSRKFL